LFLVPLGYIAAVVAAALVIVIAAIGYPDADFTAFFAGAALGMAPFVGATSFVPAAIAIVIAEIFRVRSVFYFLAAGGLIGFAAHEFTAYMGSVEFYESRRLVYSAAGFVGGFVYWLIAGIARATPAPDADRQQEKQSRME